MQQPPTRTERLDDLRGDSRRNGIDPRRNDDGFSVVELVVVLVIVSIMLAGVMFMWRSGKTAGSTSIGVATAQVYAQAVDAFAEDHAGRVPAAMGASHAGAVDWPGGAASQAGPVSPLARHDGHYLRSVPESIATGVVAVGAASSTAGTWLQYVPTGSLDGYALIVHGKDPSRDCGLGSALPAGMPKCVSDR